MAGQDDDVERELEEIRSRVRRIQRQRLVSNVSSSGIVLLLGLAWTALWTGLGLHGRGLIMLGYLPGLGLGGWVWNRLAPRESESDVGR